MDKTIDDSIYTFETMCKLNRLDHNIRDFCDFSKRYYLSSWTKELCKYCNTYEEALDIVNTSNTMYHIIDLSKIQICLPEIKIFREYDKNAITFIRKF
jgi:hypothetical protein